MRRWIAHLLGVEVEIEPLTELREAKFTWYVGLDADGSRIGDLLWNGEELDEATAGARGRAVPPDLPRSRHRDREGARRAGLSDPGDDAATSCCASSRRTSSPACRSAIWRR